jgi:N-acetylglucosamine-6-phosphate deacetylase
VRVGVEAALVDGVLVRGDVDVEDGVVTAYGLAGSGRGIAAPGFVDLQVNGIAGVDFLTADAAAYARAGEALLETGVTAYLPTFITADEPRLAEALRAVPAGDGGGARVLGVHLEGPFLATGRLGVHPPEHRHDPDLALAARLLDAGPVRLMTLAPELPGAAALIDLLHARGVTVSCGHTDATADEARRAFERGVRTVTHVFNAMRPLSHRDPGIVGAALSNPEIVVQLIADGVHIAAEIVDIVWRAAPGRVALVTDAIAAAGVGDGEFVLGDARVVVRGGVARRDGDGPLAGSVLTMIEAVRNVHALGIPLEDALTAAAAVPARAIGETGLARIAPGAPADIVVLDDGLRIDRVLVGGLTRVAA